jgi:uncharacterized iron-regulated protein
MQHPILRTLVAGCLAAATALAAAAAPARLLIFGEQHDQPDQQRQVAAELRALAERGQLAALVLEMAEQPHRTDTLSRDASEAAVREALQWKGWPWEAYAAVVMNAVHAGVPVLGGNLPRAQMRAAMADTSLDARIDQAARTRLADAVRSGHCQLLPAAQEPGMVRIQIARDLALAQVAAEALRAAPANSTVVLLTGAQHASPDRGVPLHLATIDAGFAVRVVMFGEADPGLVTDEWRPAQFTPQEDHCEALRKRLAASPAASAAAR